MSRPPVWKPWHAAPNPAEDGVVLTAKEVAEIEAARAQRRQVMKKRARLARHKAKRAAANGTTNAGPPDASADNRASE
jgi:hypothetical protein